MLTNQTQLLDSELRRVDEFFNPDFCQAKIGQSWSDSEEREERKGKVRELYRIYLGKMGKH